jgi:hypothetical protein
VTFHASIVCLVTSRFVSGFATKLGHKVFGIRGLDGVGRIKLPNDSLHELTDLCQRIMFLNLERSK